VSQNARRRGAPKEHQTPVNRPGFDGGRRPPADQDEAHRRCERVSRLIVKLRGHGLVAKIPRARRYRVTIYGQRVMTAAITLHDDHFADNYLAA
jgi:hypothetical protein